MSTTIPPAPPPMPAPPAGGGGAAMVVVLDASAKALEALAKVGQVEVTLLSRPTRGVVEVMAGDQRLTLKLPSDLISLPGGARMVLQMVGTGAEAQFRIVSLNGKPILPGGVPLVPAPALAIPTGGVPSAGAATPSGTPHATAAPASSPSPVVSAAQPLGVTATVLRPALAGSATPGAPLPESGGLPPNLPPGTTVTVRIAGTALPNAPSPAMPLAQAPAPGPAQAPAAAPPPATPAAPPPPQPVPPGIAAAPQPGAALPPAAAPAGAAPPPLTGTVTAHPPGGQAVVQTPAGTLAVPTPADLPVGAKVVLEVVGKPELPAPVAAPATKAEGLTPGGWPTLTQTIETLTTSDARLAEQFLRALPQANPRLAAAMSMFAAALRSGDARQIVSDAVTRGLDRAGKRDLADRLKGDVEKLAGDSARPLAGGEWRALTMPFLNGAQIEAIRLYVRHMPDEPEGGGRGGSGDGQRFVLEVAMTRLGRLQLDGLVRRTDKAFDLIVRSEAPLPQDMRRDITAIFVENAEVVGITGQVTFQPGRFVDLPPAAPAPPTALMV